MRRLKCRECRWKGRADVSVGGTDRRPGPPRSARAGVPSGPVGSGAAAPSTGERGGGTADWVPYTKRVGFKGMPRRRLPVGRAASQLSIAVIVGRLGCVASCCSSFSLWLVAGFADGSKAQQSTTGNPQEGRRLAIQTCGICHMVAPDQPIPPLVNTRAELSGDCQSANHYGSRIAQVPPDHPRDDRRAGRHAEPQPKRGSGDACRRLTFHDTIRKIEGDRSFRFGHLGPAGLSRSLRMGSDRRRHRLHHGSLDDDAGGGVPPQGDEELARQGDDGHLAHPSAKAPRMFNPSSSGCAVISLMPTGFGLVLVGAGKDRSAELQRHSTDELHALLVKTLAAGGDGQGLATRHGTMYFVFRYPVRRRNLDNIEPNGRYKQSQ